MVTREWVAVHRKHHARCETPQDPHSPQVLGIARVLWGGVFLYVRESRDREMVERYGRGTPNDWIETRLYSRCSYCGLVVMGLADVVAFGIGWGLLVFAIQMVWIPFWAAGVINGMGHYWGYRNYPVEDASTNLFPIGVLIGGEEFHNNHHAHPTSAKLSSAWYEFDIGWMYIRLLEMLGLARVSRVGAGTPIQPGQDGMRRRHLAGRHHPPLLRAGAIHPLGQECMPAGDQPARTARRRAQRSGDRCDLRCRAAALVAPAHLGSKSAPTADVRPDIAQGTPAADRLFDATGAERALEPVQRYDRTADQLLEQLCDWRARAESSGIAALREFARRLPHLV